MLPQTTPYTFGTMTVGADVNRLQEDTRVVRQAMDAGVWFHTARGYSSIANCNLLGRALAEDRAHAPRIMAKIRCYNPDILRYDVEDTLSMLGVERVDIAQLSLRSGESKRALVDDFIAGGPMSELCRKFQAQGKVGSLVLEVFFNTAAESLDAVERDLFDGYTFYYNLLERETSNAVFERIREKRQPLLALRAVAGGCSNPAWYAARKAKDPDSRTVRIYESVRELAALYGVTDWLEFAYAFLLGQDNVVTAIAGTTDAAHLAANIAAASSYRPIPAELMERIHAIHAEWMARA